MKRALRKFMLGTWPGRVLMIPFRLLGPILYFYRPLFRATVWLFSSREVHNYTYRLDELSLRYLVSFVSLVTGRSRAEVEGYVAEIQQDQQLRNHLLLVTSSAAERFAADEAVRYGRRIGWYALVRASKPRLAVETGVDKGLGSCVIAAALLKNAEEGFAGRLLALDINPAAGYLIRPPYDAPVKLIVGDSLDTLRKLDEPIDFFIHDSDHAAEHEANELALIEAKLSDQALVLSDNARVTDKLVAFAERTNREFLFFQDWPLKHWIQGDGIGIAFKQKNT